MQIFPHIIRVAFGNCLSCRRMRRELLEAVSIDAAGLWSNFGGLDNVTWYVLGNENAQWLKKAGAKNIRKISSLPLVHDTSVSFWYNKTLLIQEAFKDFGQKTEILYVDCDVHSTKKPDEHMASLLRGRISKGTRFLAPMRRCVKGKRVPLVTQDSFDLRICPCNCLMYCTDGEVINEMLDLYPEVSEKAGSTLTKHWTGTTTTGWDDETLAMYWFDKKNGNKTVAEIVDAFEPESVIRLQRHPPTESRTMKKPEDLYLVHH